MKVGEVMTRAVDLVDPATSVQAAATHMAELDIGAVLVGTTEAIEGILTDRDIIVRVVVEGRHPPDVRVHDVMTPEVVGCDPEDDIEQAFAAMREGQFRRMPVLKDGKPIGVVTLGDLAKHVESPEKFAEKLREISEPHRRREPAEEKPAQDKTDERKAGGDAPKSEEPATATA
jgi:CBS domain-containing protein